uniref:peptidylprolyl isomerase n=1 Tax=Brassica oleracea var. oleracea TaxID=109376 RepID=A0A0D3D4S8_BRAOL
MEDREVQCLCHQRSLAWSVLRQAGVWGIWLPANATLQFDVELLSWSSVKDICKDGGVFNKIREKWETPKDLDEVLVKYESKLEDGTVVGKSDGVEFTVKDGYLCPALAKAVKTMKKAEKVLLMVQPQLKLIGKLQDGTCLISSEAINQDEIGNCGYVVYLQVLLINTSLMFLHMRLICSIVEDSSMLHGNGSGVLEARFRKLPQGSESDSGSDSGSEAGSGRPTKLPCNVGIPLIICYMVTYPLSLSLAISSTHRRDSYCWNFTRNGQYTVKSGYWVAQNLLNKTEEREVLDPSITKLQAVAWKLKAPTKICRGEGEEPFEFKTDEDQVIDGLDRAVMKMKKQAKALKVACNLNDAACKLKLQDYKQLCTKVFELESANVKALYRRAQAYMELADFDLAEFDVKKALEIDPNNREGKVEQRRLKEKMKEFNKKEAKFLREHVCEAK